MNSRHDDRLIAFPKSCSRPINLGNNNGDPSFWECVGAASAQGLLGDYAMIDAAQDLNHIRPKLEVPL